MHLAVGLLAPSTGIIRVFDRDPQAQTLQVLNHVGFVAQNRPLYPSFTVEDMLQLGAKLNQRWDADLARISDYLILLSSGRIQVAEDIEALLATHKWSACPHDQADGVSQNGLVLQANHSSRMSTSLIRMEHPGARPGWDVRDASLEDIILGYLAFPNKALQVKKEYSL